MNQETDQRAFAALINGSGQILVVKRAKTTNNGGQFGLPGGHLNKGETVEQGCQREVFEEIGVDINFRDRSIIRVRVDSQRTLIIARMLSPGQYTLSLDPYEVESIHRMTWSDLSRCSLTQLHKSVLRLQPIINPTTGTSVATLWEILKGGQ